MRADLTFNIPGAGTLENDARPVDPVEVDVLPAKLVILFTKGDTPWSNSLSCEDLFNLGCALRSDGSRQGFALRLILVDCGDGTFDLCPRTRDLTFGRLVRLRDLRRGLANLTGAATCKKSAY